MVTQCHVVSKSVKVDEKKLPIQVIMPEFASFTDNKKGRFCYVVTNDSGKGWVGGITVPFLDAAYSIQSSA